MLLTMGCSFFAALERRTDPTGTMLPTSSSSSPSPSTTVTLTPEAVSTTAVPATATSMLTLTPTPTSTSTVEPLTATPTATEMTPPDCEVPPEGVFFSLWEADAVRQATLGCPTSNHPRIEPAAWEVTTSYQPFERGAMVWSDKVGWYEQPVIYVLYDDGTYERYDDTYESGDDGSVSETPPADLVEPILGFEKVWREQEGVRDALGWATAPETPGSGRFQLYVGGEMIWLSQRGEAFVFVREMSSYDRAAAPSFAP
jgi:hypothetical protein